MTVNKDIFFKGYESGITTMLLEVLTRDGLTVIQSNITMAETATGSGTYKGTCTAVVTKGTYDTRLNIGGSDIGSPGSVDLNEVAGSYFIMDEPTIYQMQAALAENYSGPNTIMISIVDNNSIAVQNANISIKSSGVVVGVGVTNSSGQFSLGLDAGVFSIAITAGGYAGLSSFFTVVDNVDAMETFTVSQISITPSSPGLVTGWLVARDNLQQPVAGVIHTLGFLSGPNGGVGSSFDTSEVTATSASNGLVTFVDLLPGATYQLRVGDSGDWIQFVADTIDFELPDCVK